MAVVLTKGTVEFLPIRVSNALGTFNTLDGTGLSYDLHHDNEAETVVLTNQSAQNDGMIALPLIDTTTLAEGPYAVFIKFTAFPETPRLGPYKFRVDD
jgi:5-hydroxyisourate hydrolase-like protein (transthyretin family)